MHGFLRAFGGGSAGFGLLFILIALGMSSHARRFKRRAVRVDGRIVDFTVRGSGSFQGGPVGLGGAEYAGTGPIYLPVVEFTTNEGRDMRVTAKVGSNIKAGRPGDRATVYYDPGDPHRIRVETGRTRGVTGCIEAAFLMLGGLFFLIGLGALVSTL